MDTDQLLVARLADLQQELTEALREAHKGATSLRGSVERIHGLFASLCSDEDVKHAISTLSRDTSQVVAHTPVLDMQALESRLADVLKSTDKYPYRPHLRKWRLSTKPYKGLTISCVDRPRIRTLTSRYWTRWSY